MSVVLAERGFVEVDGRRLEYRFTGPAPEVAPMLVLLHEGLGCAGLWLDFPERLALATGASVFAWSRAGYGQSSPAPLPWPLDYMQREAREVLPKLLDAIGFRRGLLIGHSDGATIAAIVRNTGQSRTEYKELVPYEVPIFEVIMAHHDTVIRAEDHVIVFCTSKKLVAKVEKLFQVGWGFF